MSKSALTLNKLIEKDKHDNSELGQLEKKMKQFYGSQRDISEEDKKAIQKIRTDNEAVQVAINEEYAEAVRIIEDKANTKTNDSLIKAMTAEVKIIDKILNDE